MTIDRVSISFNAKPNVKIDGRSYDVSKQDTLQKFTIGNQEYQGIKLDNHTYLAVTKKDTTTGKYQLDLISTQPKALEKYKVKIAGGKINQIAHLGDTFTAKQAKAVSRTFIFNKQFAQNFRKRAESKAGSEIRATGLEIDDDELYELRKNKRFTPQLYQELKDDQTAPEVRRQKLDALLSKPVQNEPSLALSLTAKSKQDPSPPSNAVNKHSANQNKQIGSPSKHSAVQYLGAPKQLADVAHKAQNAPSIQRAFKLLKQHGNSHDDCLKLLQYRPRFFTKTELPHVRKNLSSLTGSGAALRGAKERYAADVALDKALEKDGLTRKDVLADGFCFYHAVSSQVGENESKIKSRLSQKAESLAKDNQALENFDAKTAQQLKNLEYTNQLQFMLGFRNKEDIKSDIKTLNEQGNPEFATVAPMIADIYNRPVTVYAYTTEDSQVRTYNLGPQGSNKEPIYLIFNGYDHFQSAERVN